MQRWLTNVAQADEPWWKSRVWCGNAHRVSRQVQGVSAVSPDWCSPGAAPKAGEHALRLIRRPGARVRGSITICRNAHTVGDWGVWALRKAAHRSFQISMRCPDSEMLKRGRGESAHAPTLCLRHPF